MSRLCRSLRAPVVGLLLVLLVAPAATACCVAMAAAMPCCARGDQDLTLSLPCCVMEADPATGSPPASAPLVRASVHGDVSNVPVAAELVTLGRTIRVVDPTAGPPGDRLYLRLSVIRR
jgi:hypothetical protein